MARRATETGRGAERAREAAGAEAVGAEAAGSEATGAKGAGAGTRTPASKAALAGLACAVLLVLCLAGALHSDPRTVDAGEPGATQTILTVGLTLAALAVAGGIVLIVTWVARQRHGLSHQQKRVPLWMWLVQIFSPLVFFILLALVFKLAHPGGGLFAHAGAGAVGRSRPKAAGGRPFKPNGTVALTTVLVVVGGTLALLFAGWRRARRRRRPWSLRDTLRLRRPEAALPPEALAAVIASELGKVRVADPDEEQDPRAAVVAAYIAMTAAAADGGIGRRPSETASEYLATLLERLGASVRAARRLTSLFETARYSSTACGEEVRSEAIDALRQVQLELSAKEPATA